MKLLTFGCSFTEPDNGWPYRLGQLINCEVVNKGKGGVGNFYIANQVYNTVHVHNECEYQVHFNCDDSLVVVMWSGIRPVTSYIQTLHYMLGVQEFLSNRDIPYLFLTHRDIFTNRYGKYKRAKKLEANITWDKFHFTNGYFGGMEEWVKDHKLHPRLKFAKDFFHPSIKMHHKFAEYLYNLEEYTYLFK